MKMTKLEMALHLKPYIDKHPPYKELLKQLGWEKEISWQQLRKMIINLRDENSASYVKEIKILEVLKAHKKTYVWTQDIINECEFGIDYKEPTYRTMRRYIKDLRDVGFKIESKRGRTELGKSGYKLVE